MKKQKISTRRKFLKSSAMTTGVSLMGAPAIVSAQSSKDKIRMGFIGIGNRGSQLLNNFILNRDVEVAAFCDIYEPYLRRDYSKVHRRFIDELGGRIPKMEEKISGNVKRYKDFRKLLDDRDIDAVCSATPDHWHAVQAIAAMEAGKDVYVEKPLTIALAEGRKMVEVAQRTKSVTQVGLHRRSSKIYRELAEIGPEGLIGKTTVGRAFRISNMYPDGIGKARHEDPPDGFDWDMWLGPRAYRPFQYNIHPYRFRWWKSYSTQMGNWGVHYMDAIRWLTGETAPAAVSANGGKYVLDDDRTIPDTMEVTFEFASGANIVFGIYEASGGTGLPDGGEIELRGTKANLIVTERYYKVIPGRAGQFQTWDKLADPFERHLETRDNPTGNHIRNFLDCVKSREKCWCDIEDGHRSTSFAHLANIALETGSRIEWDAENERITNNREANVLLSYEYRKKPWKLG